jgi:hypothetical protein
LFAALHAAFLVFALFWAGRSQDISDIVAWGHKTKIASARHHRAATEAKIP